VPVLAGSAAYAVAEAFGLRGSLELPAERAIGSFDCRGRDPGGAALAATSIIDRHAVLDRGDQRGRRGAIMVAMMWIFRARRAAFCDHAARWIKLLAGSPQR